MWVVEQEYFLRFYLIFIQDGIIRKVICKLDNIISKEGKIFLFTKEEIKKYLILTYFKKHMTMLASSQLVQNKNFPYFYFDKYPPNT